MFLSVYTNAVGHGYEAPGPGDVRLPWTCRRIRLRLKISIEYLTSHLYPVSHRSIEYLTLHLYPVSHRSIEFILQLTVYNMVFVRVASYDLFCAVTCKFEQKLQTLFMFV